VGATLERARRDTIRRRLIAWYRRARRDLPWRRSSDPYRIWLSETMLQQTRVETVVPYYERFLARFPNVESLAAADEEDVLRLWAGLGYYARARNFRRAAQTVVREHGGALPRTADALAGLPGVGRYTAGALRSIAFKEPAAIVDGNVRRVLSRLCAVESLADTDAWRLAGELVPARDPDLFNQALMELGATLCTPRKPTCQSCPVAQVCEARASGEPERFPAPKRKAAARRTRALAGVLVRRGRVLLLRRPSHGLLGGLWEIPNIADAPATALVELVRERTGLEVAAGASLGRVRHLFTHLDLTLDLVRLDDRGGRLAAHARAEARLCGAEELTLLPLSRLMKKALAVASEADP
jgi:A/G-specific adenine glycosylase